MSLQGGAKAEDPYFHEVLYATLLDARAVQPLLRLDPPHLEGFLRRRGGMPEGGEALSGVPLGPLSPAQVVFSPSSFLSLQEPLLIQSLGKIMKKRCRKKKSKKSPAGGQHASCVLSALGTEVVLPLLWQLLVHASCLVHPSCPGLNSIAKSLNGCWR